MPNKYETIYIASPSVDSDGIKALVEKFTTLIESMSGKVLEVQQWGTKKLAYPIKKLEEGYYVLINFEAGPEVVLELERIYRITDSVIKFITVKKDEKK